jgi:hypothetical protein
MAMMKMRTKKAALLHPAQASGEAAGGTADGTEILRAIRRLPDVDGNAKIMAEAAGLAMWKAIPKPPGAAGSVKTMAPAAGMEMLKVTRALHAVDGNVKIAGGAAGLETPKVIPRPRGEDGKGDTGTSVGAGKTRKMRLMIVDTNFFSDTNFRGPVAPFFF